MHMTWSATSAGLACSHPGYKHIRDDLRIHADVSTLLQCSEEDGIDSLSKLSVSMSFRKSMMAHSASCLHWFIHGCMLQSMSEGFRLRCSKKHDGKTGLHDTPRPGSLRAQGNDFLTSSSQNGLSAKLPSSLLEDPLSRHHQQLVSQSAFLKDDYIAQLLLQARRFGGDAGISCRQPYVMHVRIAASRTGPVELEAASKHDQPFTQHAMGRF